ncbi:hypothetical protein [Modestobacter altitudinis]|nr:hypothetical protein [Modestobacter altitudinis]
MAAHPGGHSQDADGGRIQLDRRQYGARILLARAMDQAPRGTGSGRPGV